MSAPAPLLSKLRSTFSNNVSTTSASNSVGQLDPLPDASPLTTGVQLSTLEAVLDEVAPAQPLQPVPAMPPQVTPQVISQAADQLYAQVAPPVVGGASTKEHSGGSSNLVEVGAALQYVEQEKTPEIPPEVESYLQHVEDHAAQDPQEIVLADVSAVPMATNYPKKSVIVLPITPETEKAGRSKSPHFSIRWLVEWSQRVIKMFAGKVVYRQVES